MVEKLKQFQIGNFGSSLVVSISYYMKIYLDSSVFQALKREENNELYQLVLQDKESNYYCFSEAHIQDLIRDNSEEKFNDMDFMATIVDGNAWHYHKKLDIGFRTPREYYGDYEWNPDLTFETDDDLFTVLKSTYQAIPLNWHTLIDPNQWPADIPDDIKAVLSEPMTMWDFMQELLGYTQGLSNDQKKFKKLLQYLHASVGINLHYSLLKIEGFDGQNFTDWEAFANSIRKKVYDQSTLKDVYNVFIELHHSLEFYGIVKGKPKRHKFMNLINDGKHAFYAGFAHLLVTMDKDMIEKSKLVYRIHEIDTVVMSLEEFKEFLMSGKGKDLSANAMFENFENVDELPTTYEEYTLEHIFIQKTLPSWYLGHFNTLNCVSARGATYYYFKQFFRIMPMATLTIELERITNALVAHFGVDEFGLANFDLSEIESEKWNGREWRRGGMGVVLYLDEGIVVSFFKAAPKTTEVP